MFLRCRKLGENSRCRLAVVELSQNHLTIDRDIPVDRPHFCIHLKQVLAKPRVQGKNRIDQHLGALTMFVKHLAHLDLIIGTESGLVKIHAYARGLGLPSAKGPAHPAVGGTLASTSGLAFWGSPPLRLLPQGPDERRVRSSTSNSKTTEWALAREQVCPFPKDPRGPLLQPGCRRKFGGIPRRDPVRGIHQVTPRRRGQRPRPPAEAAAQPPVEGLGRLEEVQRFVTHGAG